MAQLSLHESLILAQECGNALLNDFSQEKSLFRTMVSMSDVRNLIKRLQSGKFKVDFERDPHKIASALMEILRAMTPCLFSIVYENLASFYAPEDDFMEYKKCILALLNQIHQPQYDVIKLVFRILFRLHKVNNEDLSPQLAYQFAPLLCRPLYSTYMSIRHMEDLVQIRPVIHVLIKKFPDFFPNKDTVSRSSEILSVGYARSNFPDVDYSSKSTIGHEPQHHVSGWDTSSYSAHLTFNLSDPLNVTNPSSQDVLVKRTSGDEEGTASNISNYAMDVSLNEDDDCQANSNSFSAFGNISCSKISSFSSNGESCVDILNQYNIPVKSWECSVLDFLLNDQLTVFLTESTFRSSPNDSVKSLRSSTTAQAESKSDLANSASGKSGKSVLSQSLESDDAIHSAADGKSNKLRVASRESKMRNRPSRRSKQILEFRQLKQEIGEFESGFLKKYGRSPRSADRNPAIQALYGRYQDIKRLIRNEAATDIQRIFRGHFFRRYLLKMVNQEDKSRGGWFRNPSSSNTKDSGSLFSTSGSKASTKTSHISSSSAVESLPSWEKEESSSLSSSFPSLETQSLSNSAKKDETHSFSAGAKQESKLRLNSPTVSAGPLASKTTAGANHHSISNSNNSGSLPLQSNSMSPQEISHLENSYRHLIEEKKELKKALKHFDDEFLAKNKRMPKRQDKESIRPLYQKYNELKHRIQELEATLLSLNIAVVGNGINDSVTTPRMSDSSCSDYEGSKALVDDVNSSMETDMLFLPTTSSSHNSSNFSNQIHNTNTGTTSSHGNSNNNSNNNSGSGSGSSGNSPSVATNSSSINNNFTVSTTASSSSSTSGAVQTNASNVSSSPPASLSNNPTVVALLEEKKNLHNYLKSYERDFNVRNGRPVTTHDDILPVASEYQRYKEVKKLLKQHKL